MFESRFLCKLKNSYFKFPCFEPHHDRATWNPLGIHLRDRLGIEPNFGSRSFLGTDVELTHLRPTWSRLGADSCWFTFPGKSSKSVFKTRFPTETRFLMADPRQRVDCARVTQSSNSITRRPTSVLRRKGSPVKRLQWRLRFKGSYADSSA